MWRSKAAALLLDIFWPNRCGCCGEMIAYDENVCGECAAELRTERISYADWAKRQTGVFPWADGAAVFAYAGAARDGVLALKDGQRGFAEYSAELLAEEITAVCADAPLSFVTWVPVTKRRRRMQGYAHAEMLGKKLANALQLPARGDLMTEPEGAVRQHSLKAKERVKNAKRFQPTGRRIDGETVLLVDDILTTGSTLRHCTELLLEQGAKKVYIAVICAARAVPSQR